MPKRKAEVKGRLYTRQKTVTTIDKKQIKLHISHKKFKRSIYLKPGMTKKEINTIVDDNLVKEFYTFFKRNARKGRGDKYIFTIMANMNFGGKRVKTGFSSKRKKLTKEEHFFKAMRDLKRSTVKGFLKKVMQYLARAGLTSYSIRGVKMEITTNEDTSKKQNLETRRKYQKKVAKRRKV